MIKLGTKVEFDTGAGEVTGKVVYIHPEGRYFTAEYVTGKDKERFRTSFHFVDLYGTHQCVRIAR